MTLKTAQMIDDKREFLRSLESTFKKDSRSNVKKIAYKVNMKDEEIAEEYIIIEFYSKTKMIICTTANSNAANMKAVHEAVYGEVW